MAQDKDLPNASKDVVDEPMTLEKFIAKYNDLDSDYDSRRNFSGVRFEDGFALHPMEPEAASMTAGPKMDLSDMKFNGATLRHADLHKDILEGVDFRGANLEGANLYWVRLRKADLRDANLRDANLHHADIQDADLRGVDLRGAKLSGIIANGANLSGVDLQGLNLSGHSFIQAILENTNFNHANLRDAFLNKANLSGADLRGADLSGAFLHDANLRDADLRGAKLEGAILDGAILDGAILTVDDSHRAFLGDINPAELKNAHGEEAGQSESSDVDELTDLFQEESDSYLSSLRGDYGSSVGVAEGPSNSAKQPIDSGPSPIASSSQQQAPSSSNVFNVAGRKPEIAQSPLEDSKKRREVRGGLEPGGSQKRRKVERETPSDSSSNSSLSSSISSSLSGGVSPFFHAQRQAVIQPPLNAEEVTEVIDACNAANNVLTMVGRAGFVGDEREFLKKCEDHYKSLSAEDAEKLRRMHDRLINAKAQISEAEMNVLRFLSS